jgi:hypothetical protein
MGGDLDDYICDWEIKTGVTDFGDEYCVYYVGFLESF